jgi:hypothetical protein
VKIKLATISDQCADVGAIDVETPYRDALGHFRVTHTWGLFLLNPYSIQFASLIRIHFGQVLMW